jgi:hypothetical protein
MNGTMGYIFMTLLIIYVATVIVAFVVIVYNKKMTHIGRMVRIAIIFLFPIMGPIAILIEVLSRKVHEENHR